MHLFQPFLKEATLEHEFLRLDITFREESARLGYLILGGLLAVLSLSQFFFLENSMYVVVLDTLAAGFGFSLYLALASGMHKKWIWLMPLLQSLLGTCLLIIPIFVVQWPLLQIFMGLLFLTWIWVSSGIPFSQCLSVGWLLGIGFIAAAIFTYPASVEIRWLIVIGASLISLMGTGYIYVRERNARRFFLQLMDKRDVKVSTPSFQSFNTDTADPDDRQVDWSSILRELTIDLVIISKTEMMFERLLELMGKVFDVAASAATTFNNRYIAVNSVYKGLLAKNPVNAESLWYPSLLEGLESTKTVDTDFLELGLTFGDNLLKGGHRLDIPVFSRGKLAGAVTLVRMEKRFDDFEIKLASSMVFHAMIALRYAKMQQELSRAAKYDPTITRMEKKTVKPAIELLTRKAFIEEAEKNFEERRRANDSLSLLLVEIDGFRKISQQIGPAATEHLYWAIVKMIVQQISEPRILGSYGQGTFAVQLPVDLLVAQQLAETLRSKVELNEFKAGNSYVKVTISVGVSTLSEDAVNFKTMLHSADMGLFLAKDDSGNVVRVSI